MKYNAFFAFLLAVSFVNVQCDERDVEGARHRLEETAPLVVDGKNGNLNAAPKLCVGICVGMFALAALITGASSGDNE